MKTFALATMALFAVSALPLAAAEESTGLCTFPTVPVGACADVTVGTTNMRYREAHVGETYSYQCDPFALVCVLTPDTYWSSSTLTVPWVYVDATTWCNNVCDVTITELPPIILS